MVISRQFRILAEIKQKWIKAKKEKQLEERKKQGQIMITTAYRRFCESKGTSAREANLCIVRQ